MCGSFSPFRLPIIHLLSKFVGQGFLVSETVELATSVLIIRSFNVGMIPFFTLSKAPF